MNRWTLRDYLFACFHNWPRLLVFFALGCLLGWGVAFIWPEPYRAVNQIYVGLNAYRSYADPLFSAFANPPYTNADDYKNWQMSQLNQVIFLDEFLEETLRRLRGVDTSWVDVDVAELRGMLRAEWRSAGKWSLVAEAGQARRAEQASRAWAETVVDKVSDAVQQAQQALIIDIRLQAMVEKYLADRQRKAQLLAFKQVLPELQEMIAQASPTQPLSPLQRWQVLAPLVQIADYSLLWQGILAEQPGEGDLPKTYLNWLNQALTAVEAEQTSLEASASSFERDYQKLSDQYQQVYARSYGLSPNLVIEGLGEGDGQASRMRSTALFALLGGICGILVWLVTVLISLSNVVPSPASAGKRDKVG